jgi:hypothetical protein
MPKIPIQSGRETIHENQEKVNSFVGLNFKLEKLIATVDGSTAFPLIAVIGIAMPKSPLIVAGTEFSGGSLGLT